MTTTTRTLSRRTLEEVCDYAEVETDGITETYSGRGMYGGECFGVMLPNDHCAPFLVLLGAITTETAMIAQDDMPTDQAIELGRAARTDSLGHQMIVYFPGWQLG